MDETATSNPVTHQLTSEHRRLLDEVLDKWSLQVLDTLCEQPQRFNELRRAIPVITQKSLTATLRRLERNGMIERIIISTRPVAVEYRIAALGRTLQDLIDALWQWTASTLPEVQAARDRFDEEN
ncbi:winged helix-turn-helix transcriptional regulator [Ruania zhangjianzhongii]|uniref:winged helix-turn-helix transcriptional regulator n=1 Tax=Ruania zhangjianzhongii TaxID=2603206 RepID=UPI0011C89892|nr:helix-turn-helix domain-containing protein [Ruania zhangjianzhongii]